MQVSPATAAAPHPRVLDFPGLYADQKRFLWRVLLRLGVPRSDAPDAAQEVFVIAHKKLSTFDGTSSPRTWLFGIARRVAADWRKRAHVKREEPSAKLPEQSTPAAQTAEVEARQARALLERALEQLSDEQRAVFVLFELEEWPMAEVAQAAACPLQTAYSRLHAARKVLDEIAASLRKPWDVP